MKDLNLKILMFKMSAGVERASSYNESINQ
jgi:hypothetical protein